MRIYIIHPFLAVTQEQLNQLILRLSVCVCPSETLQGKNFNNSKTASRTSVKFGENLFYNEYLLLYDRRAAKSSLNAKITPKLSQNYPKIEKNSNTSKTAQAIFVKFGDNIPYNEYLQLYNRRPGKSFLNAKVTTKLSQNSPKIRKIDR